MNSTQKLNGVSAITSGMAMILSAIVLSHKSPGFFPLVAAAAGAFACAVGGSLLSTRNIDSCNDVLEHVSDAPLNDRKGNHSEMDQSTTNETPRRWGSKLAVIIGLGIAVGTLYLTKKTRDDEAAVIAASSAPSQTMEPYCTYGKLVNNTDCVGQLEHNAECTYGEGVNNTHCVLTTPQNSADSAPTHSTAPMR